MNKKGNNYFDNEIRYKLYSSIKNIIKPSISKKNISNYRIIFNDNLLPVRIFYPEKVSNLNNIIIYIPGDVKVTNCSQKYTNICTELAKELDKLVIAIDYYSIKSIYPNTLEQIEKIVKYLYEELINIGIDKDNITLMGDSTGGNFASSITFRFINNNIDYITKQILLYPLVSGSYYSNFKYKSFERGLELNKELVKNIQEYMRKYAKKKNNLLLKDISPILNNEYNKYPKTLIITGDLDPLRDEGEDFSKRIDCIYKNIKDAPHGFINTKDLNIRHEYLETIKEFI